MTDKIDALFKQWLATFRGVRRESGMRFAFRAAYSLATKAERERVLGICKQAYKDNALSEYSDFNWQAACLEIERRIKESE